MHTILQSLINSLSAHIALLDAEGRITATNRAWDDFAHHNAGQATPHAYIGANYLEICAQSAQRWDVTAADVLVGLNAVLSGQQAHFRIEYPCHAPDKLRWFVMNAVPLQDGSGGCLVSHEEITAQKLVEQRLIEERNLHQRYLDAAATMLVALDDEGNVIRINQKACDILGYADDEVVGKNWFDYFLPADRIADVKAVFDQLMSGQVDPVAYYENLVRTRGGESRLIAWHNNYLRGNDGKINGIIASGEDITDRRQIEGALRNSEDWFRTIFDSISDGLFIHDSASGRILDVNGRTAEMYGYARGEMPALSVGELSAGFPPYAEEDARRWLEKSHAGETPVFEWLAKHRDGHLFWVEISMRQAEIGGRRYDIVSARDISERRRMRDALQLEAERWTEAMDQFDDVIYLLDTQRHLVRANKAFYQMTQSTPGQMLGRHITEIIHPHGEAAPCPVCVAQSELRDASITMEADHPDNPGGRPIEIKVKVLRDAGEQPTGILMSLHDLSAGRALDDKLRLAASVFANTREGVMITGPDGRIEAVNSAFTEITGFSEAEALGQTPRLIRSDRHEPDFYKRMWASIAETGHWQGEVWNRRKSGEIYPSLLTISAVQSGVSQVSHYVAVFADISPMKETEARLEHLAHYDLLTSLPNRRLLNIRLEHAVSRASRHGHSVAVLFIDLDRFKNVNDSLGHPAGDELLVTIAQRVQNRLRDEDTLARLGGDEFVILLESIQKPEDAAIVAQELVQLLAQPFTLSGGHEVYVGASIGISLYPADAKDATQLIRNADAALYQAKDAGRNTYRFYTQTLTRSAQERLALESHLRRAIEREEFLLHYQPQISVIDGSVTGVEALVRWNHPVEGLIAPVRFIPLAEETGLIVQLGEWVLRESCRQARAWLDQGLPPIVMSVNLSTRQFSQPDLAERIQRILVETGLPASQLELEITESALMEQGEHAIATIQALKGLGITLSIDDFGTGYSSLAYLKRFAVDKLKIDRSFVQDIPTDQSDMEIAATIIAMARNLKLKVLAEGVESEDQLAFLQIHSCDAYQGYHFSRPVEAEEITNLLHASRNRD